MQSERKGFFKEMAVPKGALIAVGALVILGFSIGVINEAIALVN